MFAKLGVLLLSLLKSGHGIVTTEFWVVVGCLGLSGVVTLGILPFDAMTAIVGSVAGLVANAAVVMAYIHGRSKVKASSTNAGNLQEILSKVLSTAKE